MQTHIVDKDLESLFTIYRWYFCRFPEFLKMGKACDNQYRAMISNWEE